MGDFVPLTLPPFSSKEAECRREMKVNEKVSELKFAERRFPPALCASTSCRHFAGGLGEASLSRYRVKVKRQLAF